VSSLDTALLRALRASEVYVPRADLASLLRTTDRTVSENGCRPAGRGIRNR
jgi:hypothetical protein